jgi:hypothetical protein
VKGAGDPSAFVYPIAPGCRNRVDSLDEIPNVATLSPFFAAFN